MRSFLHVMRSILVQTRCSGMQIFDSDQNSSRLAADQHVQAALVLVGQSLEGLEKALAGLRKLFQRLCRRHCCPSHCLRMAGTGKHPSLQRGGFIQSGPDLQAA